MAGGGRINNGQAACKGRDHGSYRPWEPASELYNKHVSLIRAKRTPHEHYIHPFRSHLLHALSHSDFYI